MASATTKRGQADPTALFDEPIEGDQWVVINGLDWKGYSTILRVKGDRCYPKMVYLDGSLWLMTPGADHEFIKIRAGSFVHEVVAGLGLRCLPTASTTFRKKKRGGFESDQSYYFASTLPRVGPNKIDLRLGPPPDLVIEVVYTHAAGPTIETCERLGVPEMWICDERAFRILVRQENGLYAESPTSRSLPFLTGEEVESWLRRPFGEDETPWILELRRWVQEVLVPRVRGGNPA